jgi:H+-transporting ATPase
LSSSLARSPRAHAAGYEDFGVLLLLQILNGVIGYWEESNAGNAIAALRSTLAPQCVVRRDGEWRTMPARELVPLDLISLRMGDVAPADCRLRGEGTLQVDQAALTGESLPVMARERDIVMMGSVVKEGEATAVVNAIGSTTFMGRAAGLVSSVESGSHVQTTMLRVLAALTVVAAIISPFIFVALLIANVGADFNATVGGGSTFLSALAITVAVFISSIPVPMQIVMTSTLAIGSRELSRKHVIVARLSAIEELAGMTDLCSDKTGTLTQNKLSLREPVVLAERVASDDVLLYAALASRPPGGHQDAIDACITAVSAGARV